MTQDENKCNIFNMQILRTRFKEEIIAEFLPGREGSNKVIIICTGMPGYPGRRDELLEFLAKEGYWTILPRYRGTWESDGKFLKESPHQDILDIISELESGFTELWGMNRFSIKNPEIYLLGSSFGGPAVLLASKHPRVKKAVALSPVVDWRVESKVEPFEHLSRFMREAFGNGYRLDSSDFFKLKEGRFYNPVDEISNLSADKIMIYHAKDDEVVDFEPVKKFTKKLGCLFVPHKSGGHLSTSTIMTPRFWKKIKKFLDGE